MGWMDGWVGRWRRRRFGTIWFSHRFGCPWAASPAPVTGSRRETRDQGAAQPGLGPPPAGGPGDEPREGASLGALGDWKAYWLLPLRTPLFCFVVRSS